MSQSITAVLDFWFGVPESIGYGKPKKEWFVKDAEFDNELRSRFFATYNLAAEGKLNDWRDSPEGCLALILVFDQFPRNIFRNMPQAFATDSLALDLAKYAVNSGFDAALLNVQKWFVYLPLEHSENLADQAEAVRLFSTLQGDPNSVSAIDYARRHLEVIKRFGRFPHRNKILGRASTPAEIEFLKTPGSRF
ncbi:MAG: DUF924 domain-containing protein [Cyanobacteria bacterium J083]|nr:MAG: DUF924 domain-containing protein [Cyanobacteria bacterium J083]